MGHMVQQTIHTYATVSNRQKQFLWTYMYVMYVMYVLTSATDSFNIHTSLVSLDPSFFFNMHVNGNFNSNYHVYVHVIQRMEREGSSHTGLCIHTHECTLWL